MQDLKVSRSTTYIRLHQNHTCRTKYRKPRRVWGSLRLWWPLAFAIWQVFQEAYVTLEALALGSGMEADGSHVTCYLGWGLGIIIRAWRGRGFKNPPLITAPVWHISRIIFWVEGFRCQCHATKTLKKRHPPKQYFWHTAFGEKPLWLWFFWVRPLPNWLARITMAPLICRIHICPRPVDGNHLVDIGRIGFLWPFKIRISRTGVILEIEIHR